MSIGERLREERKRLGNKSQEAFAVQCGSVKKSQTNYELDRTVIPATYLAAGATIGLDVMYVLTGAVSPPIDNAERELLRRYRSASPEIRAAVFAALGAVLAPSPPTAPAVAISGGQQGQVLAGNAKQEGLTINVGSQKRGKKK